MIDYWLYHFFLAFPVEAWTLQYVKYVDDDNDDDDTKPEKKQNSSFIRAK